MRLTAILRAGARATAKVPKAQKPAATKTRTRVTKVKAESAVKAVPESSSAVPFLGMDDPEAEEAADLSGDDFSGRVHSESYSAQNLSAAFESILKTKPPRLETPRSSPSEVPKNVASSAFLATINKATLPTIEAYRTSILTSLALDDPHGRVYSKNVRQMKEILGFEKWRKKLESNGSPKKTPERIPGTQKLLPSGSLAARRTLFARPSVADQALAASIVKDLWKLDRLVDATVVLAYSGHPALIDEILKLKNIRKVIAIEEVPEYCLMYHDRWAEEIKAKRFFQIKNDGYWWESYSELEEEGLLDDVKIMPWDVPHPSLFFISQLPHGKRSLQFIVQLISFIPNRNWLFQYGRLGLGLITDVDLCERLTRQRADKKYTRMTATTNCLTDITASTQLPSMVLKSDQFFPMNLLTWNQEQSANSSKLCEALLIEPLAHVKLTSDEFECLTFLQRHMFILSATDWVDAISHAAAGASIMYDKLEAKNQTIPRSTTPRMMTGEQWINLSRCFNEWPFKPRSFENELELALDDTYNL